MPLVALERVARERGGSPPLTRARMRKGDNERGKGEATKVSLSSRFSLLSPEVDKPSKFFIKTLNAAEYIESNI